MSMNRRDFFSALAAASAALSAGVGAAASVATLVRLPDPGAPETPTTVAGAVAVPEAVDEKKEVPEWVRFIIEGNALPIETRTDRRGNLVVTFAMADMAVRLGHRPGLVDVHELFLNRPIAAVTIYNGMMFEVSFR